MSEQDARGWVMCHLDVQEQSLSYLTILRGVYMVYKKG